MSKCNANETPVRCCMGVGAITGNSDYATSYNRVSTNRAEAGETLTALTERARGMESEPCQVAPTFIEESEGVHLDIDFVFACETETLIFQSDLC